MLEFDEDTYPQRNPAISLLLILAVVFIGFVVIGPLIGFVVSYPFFSGTILEYANSIQNIPEHPELKILIYSIQGCATLFGLMIAPALLLKAERKNIRNLFPAGKSHFIPFILTAVIVLAFMAANSVFIHWNASVEFPDFLKSFETWAKEKENAAARITDVLTHFDSMLEVILALIVLAVLPAIGEEFVFRGLIQNEFYRGTKNIHLSIWISAILFSAIHVQFYGFVPRMLLGALFGYLYYWSGNLSIAILAHFVNNAFSVLGIYLSQLGYLEKESIESSEAASWPAVLLSTLLTIFLLYIFRKHYQQKVIQ